VKVKEIIKLIEKEGWFEVRQKGSHKQFRHPEKLGLVTIPFHGGNKEVPKGLENSILKKQG
jgi:predicted RNA binding protein YcfA (HicA-like mRNA interferase family)